MKNPKFLKRRGAPAILLEIADGDRQFSDLQDPIAMSPNTLSKRLREGESEGLWEERLDKSGEGPSRRVYTILPAGEKLAEIIRELDVMELTEKLREIEAERERRLSEAQDRQLSA